MSKVKGHIFYAEPEKENTCEYCGKVAELRSYGRNGANICFQCLILNEDEAKEEFRKRIENCETVVLVIKDGE